MRSTPDESSPGRRELNRLGRAAAATCWFVATACAAPAARPATGDVANAVERALESGTQTFDHSDWDGLLAAGTRDGLVDYAYMTRNRGDIDAYVGRIAAIDLSLLAPDELKALLIKFKHLDHFITEHQ